MNHYQPDSTRSSKALCPICGRTMTAARDGTMYRHTIGAAQCPGSYRPPATTPDEIRAATAAGQAVKAIRALADHDGNSERLALVARLLTTLLP